MRPAGRTFVRNLPDEREVPRISSGFEHVQKVRQKNSNSISKLIKSHFDRREEVVEAARIFALDLDMPKCSAISSSM